MMLNNFACLTLLLLIRYFFLAPAHTDPDKMRQKNIQEILIKTALGDQLDRFNHIDDNVLEKGNKTQKMPNTIQKHPAAMSSADSDFIENNKLITIGSYLL